MVHAELQKTDTCSESGVPLCAATHVKLVMANFFAFCRSFYLTFVCLFGTVIRTELWLLISATRLVTRCQLDFNSRFLRPHQRMMDPHKLMRTAIGQREHGRKKYRLRCHPLVRPGGGVTSPSTPPLPSRDGSLSAADSVTLPRVASACGQAIRQTREKTSAAYHCRPPTVEQTHQRP